MNEAVTDEVVETVLAFVRARFPAVGDSVSRDTPLLEDGAVDSLGILELMTFVGERYGIEITDEDFVPENFETVDSLVRLVKQRQQ